MSARERRVRYDVLVYLAARVRAVPGPDGLGDCWHWRGACNSAGRPVMKFKGRCVLVARLALWWRLGRAVRRGFLATHRCDDPMCVRPSHLKEGTPSTNLREAYARFRRGAPWHYQQAPRTFTRDGAP